MKLYEKMRDGENLDCCRPYVSPDGSMWVIVKEGKVDRIIEKFNTAYGLSYTFIHPNIDVVRSFARKYNADYDEFDNLYSQYVYGQYDEVMLLDALEEKGCFDCPFRDECEFMEDSGEDDERI